MMRSGNPTLKDNTFTEARAAAGQAVMTIQGTVNKTFMLLGLCITGAALVWGRPAVAMPFVWPALIVATIMAFTIIFKKEWAPTVAPVYAFLEGIVLGVISNVFEVKYPGIVIQAISLTFGTLFCLLLAYKSRLIKVTENLKLGIVAATGAVAVLYIINLIMGFFGNSIPFIHESGIAGIAFSAIVVVIAAFNLVLDFDFIEKGSEYGAPKYMEWYGAFGLIVTLIWLYLEILRLLAKTRNR